MSNRLDSKQARAILTAYGIEPAADYHALNSTQVDALLAAADERRYRKRRNANGSRARYFHGYLERTRRYLSVPDLSELLAETIAQQNKETS